MYSGLNCPVPNLERHKVLPERAGGLQRPICTQEVLEVRELQM